MNDFFGHTWTEIQEMQQGKWKPKVIDVAKPSTEGEEAHLESDLAMLAEHGEEGLRDKGFFGVLGRLERAGKLVSGAGGRE